MPERRFEIGEYRYGFNGQEFDSEWLGEGNAVSFKYRVHDARLGRFLSVDPLAPGYPWNSTYAFAENKVIQFLELEGLQAAPGGANAARPSSRPRLMGNRAPESEGPVPTAARVSQISKIRNDHNNPRRENNNSPLWGHNFGSDGNVYYLGPAPESVGKSLMERDYDSKVLSGEIKVDPLSIEGGLQRMASARANGYREPWLPKGSVERLDPNSYSEEEIQALNQKAISEGLGSLSIQEQAAIGGNQIGAGDNLFWGTNIDIPPVNVFMTEQSNRLNKKLGDKIGKGDLPYSTGKKGVLDAIESVRTTLANPSQITGILSSSGLRGQFDLIHIYSSKSGNTVSIRVLGDGKYEFDTLIPGKSSKF